MNSDFCRDPKYASKFDFPKFFLLFLFPKLAKLLGIYALDKDSSLFFVNIVRMTIENRRYFSQLKPDDYNTIIRKTGASRHDIIDIFIEELEKERTDIFLPKEDFEIGLVSTAILFFFAGFDTTSTTLGAVVFGLVHHTEVQERLREEIEEVLGDSERITADHLRDMKYTENVINEALRRYFNAGRLN